jgi:sodium-coupled neutral amino acid transporter 9
MFDYKNVPALILRLAVFMLLFSTYPLVHFFFNSICMTLFFRGKTLARSTEVGINIGITFVPLLFALFYPNIGTILGYIGAISGFFMIYLFPVLVHLK